MIKKGDLLLSEERIRRAEKIPAIAWLRDLSQDKFLEFLGKFLKYFLV